MSTTETDSQVERDRLREDASSWWYGGSECPVGPETPVRTAGTGARLHSGGHCPVVPDLADTEEGLRRWRISRLRDHPPACRDLCPRCWPDAILPPGKVNNDDGNSQTQLANWGVQR